MFLDQNNDLYICSVLQPAPLKLAASVQSYAWNDGTDILAAISDNHLVVWYYPAACLVNKDLLASTCERTPLMNSDNATIESFSGQVVNVRLANGANVTHTVSAYALKLFALAQQNRYVFCKAATQM